MKRTQKAGKARGGAAPLTSLSKAPGNAIPPRTQQGGGVDTVGGTAAAAQIARMSLDERPPHSALNPTRNADDLYQPGPRRQNAEQGRPLPGMGMTRQVGGLRGRGRVAR
jgi:hypothetical protein